MTENEEQIEVVIRKGTEKKWKDFVSDVIDMMPGRKRDYAIILLNQIASALKNLGAPVTPAEVVTAISVELTLVQAAEFARAVTSFSPRGEEFRVYWNQWHGREHPTMLYNPSRMNDGSQSIVLIGNFDPQVPITQAENFSDIVDRSLEHLKLLAEAEA